MWDFLFSYYSLRPGQLRVWHPGYGIALGGAEAARYLGRPGYDAIGDRVTLGGAYLCARISAVRFVYDLLTATADREPQFGCFGMHEWAMVYGSDTASEAIRHARVPLRLGTAGTDRVLESIPLRCSHFDANRFFTTAAAPRNQCRPTRDTQSDWEQPACLHANMDLYKWAYKLGPLVESALVLDCLELAFEARDLDMRASPYDLRAHGFEPIPVEDPAGRAEYVRLQAGIARRAAPLRAALIRHCELLLAAGREAASGVSEPVRAPDRIN